MSVGARRRRRRRASYGAGRTRSGGLVIRCSVPCSKTLGDCNLHDGETVGPDTPTPPYHDHCFCWVERVGPDHQAVETAEHEGNTER